MKLNDLSLYEFSGSSGSAGFLLSPGGGGTSKNAPDFLWFEFTFLDDGFRLNAVIPPSETSHTNILFLKRHSRVVKKKKKTDGEHVM